MQTRFAIAPAMCGLILMALGVAGCTPAPVLGYGPEPVTQRYTDPAASGLRAIRPYPDPEDVCVVIGENPAVADLLDHTTLLIACPKHERGALDDRIAEGARVVAHARHWTLLAAPLDR